MFQHDPEAGTGVPPVETADEAAIDSGEGTSGSEDEGNEEKVTISKREYLVIKDARQREKVAEAEVERLRAERETRNTTDNRESAA
jgi:hypothetical protein